MVRALFAFAAFSLAAGIAAAGDWPNWRGPTHNNSSSETGLPDRWSPKGGEGSNLLWKSRELAGRSTPIVMAGRLYTLVRDQPETELEGEAVVCADAATGKVLWRHRFNVYLSDVPDTRVGWSSVVGDPETGRVYAQGVCGYFCCLDGETGKVLWERSLHEELGLLSTYGGRTNFPLIYKDTVITSAVVIGWGDTPKWGLLAKPAHRFMAFDKATGELRWLSGTRLIPYDTTYSTPTLTNIQGQDLLVFGSGDGAVWGMQAATGKTVWKAQLSRRGLNVSPAVSPDGRVFTGHSEENTVGNTMGAFVALDGKSQGESGPVEIADDQLAWKNYQVMAGKSSPLFIDDKVYVTTDSAKMLVFDSKTGEQLERKALGRASRGTPLYADGKIYYASRGGRFFVLEPQADGSLKTLSKANLRGEQIDASPIAAGGRVYLTTSDYVYCIGNPEWQPSEQLQTSSHTLDDDTTPAQLVLSPYDSLLQPGMSQVFTARIYNKNGNLIRIASADEVQLKVDGEQEAMWGHARGLEYIAPIHGALGWQPELNTCNLVTAEVGDLTATARVRVVPPTGKQHAGAWNFDFEDGATDVPLTWVGGRVRYNLREDESGNHYLAKPIELPTRPGKPTTKLGTRSRMWMGPSDMADYTIQADVQMQTGVAGEADSFSSSNDEQPSPAELAAAREMVAEKLSQPQTRAVIDPSLPSLGSNTAIKLPSVGLINSRYTFTLFGPSNEARLYSWCTHDRRTQAAVPIKFEPGVWYTMKLKVVPEPDEEHSHVYAKVWRRDEAEPSSWTLDFEDEAPNYQGSPGLFGDAKEAEFYVDNLSVTSNNAE